MTSGDGAQDSSSSPERQDRETDLANTNTRKRKQRQPLSCAECRRLKLKCDRSVPCANCVRRSCADICPDVARQPTKVNQEETHDLKARLEALEGLLRCSGIETSSLMEVTRRPAQDVDESDKAKRTKRVRLDLGGANKEAGSSTGGALGVLHMSDTRPNAPQAPLPQSDNTTLPAMTDLSHLDASAMSSRNEINIPAHLHAHGNVGASNSLQSISGNNVYFEPSPALVFDYGDSHQSGIQTEDRTAWDSRPDALTMPDANYMSPEPSSGTLVISKYGGSKYFGHTAASEWLKDQEVQEAGDNTSPRPSRLPSPEHPDSNVRPTHNATVGVFPFQVSSASSSTAHLLASLPDVAEAHVLMGSYYRYFAWHFDVAPRSTVEPLLEKMYEYKQGRSSGNTGDRPDCQRLALLFIIFAMGALHSLELPPNDPSADEYLDLAKRSLAKTDFLTHSTVAAVQTLHIMAHYHLETEKGRNGDSAWPLWGIAMRLLQAMGLHRDGSKWNLGNDVVEERRRVFWECYSADIFQANCFSRPSSIAPQYFDAAYPEIPAETLAEGSPRHDLLKFELSQISAQVLDHAMRIQTPPYASVTELHNKLVSFERRIPYALRCRAVLMALPSMYLDAETAIRESPEVTRKDLPKTLQQFTLALNVSEALLFLHRPYFARALHERKPDPTQTSYGQSYLCVVERCNVMIQICAAIYSLHPGVVARHWYFWYHVFNAAVCMGTLILQNPRNILAPLAMSLINSAITLYTSIVQSNSAGRLLKNLEWLLRLRHRASTRMAASSSGDDGTFPNIPEDEEEDVELLGWRTRLVSRLGKGAQVAVTITPTQSAATPSPNTAMARTIHQALQKHFVPDDQQSAARTVPVGVSGDAPDQATDHLLHQFWDPMMLQDHPGGSSDLFSSSEWWNWDPDAPREEWPGSGAQGQALS